MIEHNLSMAITLSGFCALLLLLSAIRHYSRNSILPAESWTLLIGLAYGMSQSHLPFLPVLALSPELVIVLLLPTLIYASARALSPADVASNWLPIAFFAVIGVMATLFLIGLPLHWVMGIPLSHALLFAASVAATDPSAVSAIFQRFPVPEKLAALVEGESLFNDGTAIVIFLTMASLVLSMDQFVLGETAEQFLWTLGAAVPLGMLLGWLAAKLIVIWSEQNRFSGLSLTIALAYGSFLLAENTLHVSGVITVMCAAWMFVYTRGSVASGSSEPEIYITFWDYLNQLAGGILFFALGVTAGQHDFPLSWIIPGIIAILIVSRMILVYGGSLLFRLFKHPLPISWQHVLTLGGLRGAVSAALVLMIPDTYEYREEMLCLVLVLCLYTLVIHPPLLHFYLKKEPFKE